MQRIQSVSEGVTFRHCSADPPRRAHVTVHWTSGREGEEQCWALAGWLEYLASIMKYHLLSA